ncbi:MAG: Holliday junction branch migration protein RuvA [Suipraeoptans sp.]
MISYIRGELDSKYEKKVVVDVGGMGYSIFMSGEAISSLPPVGEEVKIHTYLSVKEDAMQLFGFHTYDDLEIFKQIIQVSGIGPKGGLAILSVLSPDKLRLAIIAKDAKAISKAPGIGKKTAEKLIIELSDKVNIEDTLSVNTGNGNDARNISDDIFSEAIMALVSLGYGNSEALKAVKKVTVTEDMNVEDILKQALKFVIM